MDGTKGWLSASIVDHFSGLPLIPLSRLTLATVLLYVWLVSPAMRVVHAGLRPGPIAKIAEACPLFKSVSDTSIDVR